MFKSLSQAETPAQMRAAINAGMADNPVIRNVLMLARYEGMTAEDTYTLLAYHAIQAMIQTQSNFLDMAQRMPAPSAIVIPLST